MTSNSIAYANYRETVRHNGVMERLEAMKRDVERRNADITERRNRVDALYQKLGYGESVRHNQETENTARWNNMFQNYYSALKQREEVRHNVESEKISNESNQVGWYNAETNRINSAINQGHLEETVRSNLAHENITVRGQDFGLKAAQVNAAASRYVADMNYAGTQMMADTNARIAEMNDITNRYRINTEADVDRYRTDTDRATRLDVARWNNVTNYYTSQTEQGTKRDVERARLGTEGIYNAMNFGLNITNSIWGAGSKLLGGYMAGGG